VVCAAPATEVHHLLERALFTDGGYYLSNAVSLCNPCHVLAEDTTLSRIVLSQKARIDWPYTPEFLWDYVVDKWANVLGDDLLHPGDLATTPGCTPVIESARRGWYLSPLRPAPLTPFVTEFPDDSATLSLSVGSPRAWVQAIRYGRDLFVYDHDFKNVEADADLAGSLLGLPEQWRLVGTLFSSGFTPHCLIDATDNILSWTETHEWCELLGFVPAKEASSGYARPIENFPLASHVRRTSFFRP
jgi:hypothetical protein